MAKKEYKEGEIKCYRCNGHGMITSWQFGVKEPDECSTCGGKGFIYQYKNGACAMWRGGPFV